MSKMKHVQIPQRFLHDAKGVETAVVTSIYNVENVPFPSSFAADWQWARAAQITFHNIAAPYVVVGPGAPGTFIAATTVVSGLPINAGMIEHTDSTIEFENNLYSGCFRLCGHITLDQNDAAPQEIEVILMATDVDPYGPNKVKQRALLQPNVKRDFTFILFATSAGGAPATPSFATFFVRLTGGGTDINVYSMSISVEEIAFENSGAF